MSKRVAIVQSSYVPWKGYFDLIRSVDEFVLFDDVQYTRRDWRNRNRIKTPQGLHWLSIPVRVAGLYHQRVRDTEVEGAGWAPAHWTTIAHTYSRAPFFHDYRDRLRDLYLGTTTVRLSDINHRFLTALCGLLGIDTKISWSMDYTLADGQTERLVSICRQAGATEYLSGPSARKYIDPALFERAGISLRFMDYGAYPEYPQLHGPFEHQVSIIDLILQTGPAAATYLDHVSLEEPSL
jgi:hypothetical protein